MKEGPLVNIIHALDVITIKEISDLIILHVDHIDQLTDENVVPDMDHVQILKTKTFQDVHLPLDPLQDQEILEI